MATSAALRHIFRCRPATAQRKVELLHKSFPSQRHRDWWDEEVFLGMARMRGMECRAPYAEAFHCTKFLLHSPPWHPAAIPSGGTGARRLAGMYQGRTLAAHVVATGPVAASSGWWRQEEAPWKSALYRALLVR